MQSLNSALLGSWCVRTDIPTRRKSMFRNVKALLCAASAALIGLSAPVHSQEKINLSIATGGTGGVYLPLGGGLAHVLSQDVPGVPATAEVTGGSFDTRKLIGAGKPYIAM